MTYFKIFDVTDWTTNKYNTLLPNISRREGNQIKKFVQLIEYNMQNIFLEKLYTKCGGEASPRPFYEKLKLSRTLDQQFESMS